MAYDKEDMQELRRLQNYFKRQISSKSWDIIVDRLSDTYVNIIGRINSAENPDDISWLVMRNAYYVEDRIRQLRKQINIKKQR